MYILNMKSYNTNYLNSKINGTANVDTTTANKLGNFFIKKYPANYYGVITESDEAFEQHNKGELKKVLSRLSIASMHSIVMLEYNGLRTLTPNPQTIGIALVEYKITKPVEIETNTLRRILVTCYDGTAYMDEIDTPADVDAFFAEVSRLTGVAIEA